MSKKIVVMSVGGSLINPGQIDIGFLKRFKSFIKKSPYKFILVCGGGKPAREYIAGARELGLNTESQDWVGIAGTMLNAELLRQLFKSLPVEQKPRKVNFKKVFVVSGWLPGCSTDFDAVLWAKKHGVKAVFNLSNTDYVYSKDPRKFKDAKPFRKISWRDYKKMISSKWEAGISAPFDPVASRAAEKAGMKVFVINGQKLRELENAIQDKSFVGTVIR